MNEIEVGEYIRTEKGDIGKVNRIIKTSTGKSYYLILINKDEMDIFEQAVKIHSKNIIDLIEINDYVNGHKVIELFYGEDDNEMYMILEAPFDERAIYVGEKDIKTIVTKEQFNSVMYKVVE